jgi:hypothetical protein
MGVLLHCPNCNRIVGEASHEDNYKEVFYYYDEDGKPTCPNCGDGKFPKGCLIIFGILIIISIVLGFIFN